MLARIRSLSAADEYDYVRWTLFRRIRDVMRPNETVFYDNGHHSLYFMTGLLRFLTETYAEFKV
jgi:hypothetical protein